MDLHLHAAIFQRSVLVMVPSPQTHPPGTSRLHLVDVDGVISPSTERVELDVPRHTLHLDLSDIWKHFLIFRSPGRRGNQGKVGCFYHFQGPFDVDALAPGHGGISQAVARAPPAGHVHALTSKVTEGLRDHQDGIVGQR